MVSHTEKVKTEAPLTSGMDAKREEQPNDTTYLFRRMLYQALTAMVGTVLFT